MKKAIAIMTSLIMGMSAVCARTLIVYYSYTNNVERIVNELRTQIDADVIEIHPAEKCLDYAANNYAIGSAQISAIRSNPDNVSSYPAIDPVNVSLADYDCVIIGAPLWWSNMAAPMQTFLFQHGKEMAGKNIGLIVSSASSGISGVESDARRLVPEGKFFSRSLWIRSSQTSNAKSLIADWLKAVGYSNLPSSLGDTLTDTADRYTVYTLSGDRVLAGAPSTSGLPKGIYIVNGKKTVIRE